MPRKPKRNNQRDINQDEHWQQAWTNPETIDAATKNEMLHTIHQRIDNNRRKKKQLLIIGITAAAILAAIFVTIPGVNIYRAPASEWQQMASGHSSKKVLLADGSELWLAPHSVLQVRSNFQEQRSTVLTKGTVFFSVAKDATHPFSIAVNSQQVTVLGTAFTIRRLDAVDVQLTVKEGKVALGNRSGRSFLTAGQQVSTHAATTGKIATIDPAAADWWLQQQIRLHNITLEELLNRIETYYQVKLSHGSVNGKMKVTLTWNMGISLKENLLVLNSLTGHNIH